MFQSLVAKAEKGTLVYTDLPLVQKLESAPKVTDYGGDRKSKESTNQVVNINNLKVSGDSQDYIFGRLKRDAELGNEKAIETVEKVKKGEFKFLL